MTEPTPNLPLLRQVLDHIDAHPEEHNQEIWGFELHWEEAAVLRDVNVRAGKCETACCIAGWAIAIAAPAAWDSGHWDSDDAADLLGVTEMEADALFAAANSREDIQRHAEAIAARAGERL